MLHQLNGAGTDEAVIEQCERSGRPLPERLLNAPALSQGLGLFWRAFEQLTSCRQIGMSAGPIPWTAIRMWCEEHDVVGRQRWRVFNHVRAMDNAYLKHLADKV